MSFLNTSIPTAMGKLVNEFSRKDSTSYASQAGTKGAELFVTIAAFATGAILVGSGFRKLFGIGGSSTGNHEQNSRDNRRGHIRDSARFRR